MEKYVEIQLKEGKPDWKHEDKIYLMVLNVMKVPPHIALVYQGRYYDLTIKGANAGMDFKHILTKINRKKIPTLIFETTVGNSFSANAILQNAFLNADKIDAGNVTCLSPVKEFYGKMLSACSEAKTIFELVEFLRKRQSVGGAYTLHAEVDNHIFKWKKYSAAELKESLHNFIINEHA